ncbi:hypothetical protein DER45DRAFT_564725 [Fusarium avenaceum]|nr:hypothetical protein DER45DRAFT_564725 [Fusarium avenaceum]
MLQYGYTLRRPVLPVLPVLTTATCTCGQKKQGSDSIVAHPYRQNVSKETRSTLNNYHNHLISQHLCRQNTQAKGPKDVDPQQPPKQRQITKLWGGFSPSPPWPPCTGSKLESNGATRCHSTVGGRGRPPFEE